MTDLNRVPRAQKHDIAQKLHANLVKRAANGPAETTLDNYIAELAGSAQALHAPIVGNLLADAERTARLAQLDAVDCDVDTWYRHIASYIDVEAHRRVGPHVALALALQGAAFPDGLAHVDDPVADENRLCRESLTVLRSPEYSPALAAIALPTAWLDAWEASLAQSEAIHGAIEQARTAGRTHVSAGRDAETEFVEICVRLRRYIGSRAASSDKAKVAEGKTLLAPLLDVMARIRATSAARATIRENEKKAASPVAPAKPVDGQPG